MNNTIRSIMKRVLLVGLSIAMVITFIPSYTWAAEDNLNSSSGTETGEEIFRDLTNPGTPEGYDDTKAKNPYGYKKTPTSLLRNSGLMFAASAYRTSSDISKEFNLGKGYKGGTPLGHARMPSSSWNESKVSGNGDRMNDYMYIQSVAFDPDGDGLRDVIAFIGFRIKSDGYQDIRIWTLKTKNGTEGSFEDNETSLGQATWMDSNNISNLRFYGHMFLSITAGDYDADGKDTIVAYACLDGENYSLFEYEYKYDTYTKPLQLKAQGKTLLNPAYNEDTACHTDGSEINDKLRASLTSGDLDNDGIDDLVVTSEMGDNMDAAKQKAREAYVAVSLGKEGMSTSPVSGKSTGIYVENESEAGFKSLTSTTADIGQISADGYNKLTVGGYRIVKDSNGKYHDGLDNTSGMTPGEYTYTDAYFYEMKNGKLSAYRDHIGFRTDSSLYSTIVGAGHDFKYGPPRAVVASAYADGFGRQEHIFINGRIYKQESDGSLALKKSFYDVSVRLITGITTASLKTNGCGVEEFAVASYAEGSAYGNHVPTLSIISGDAEFDAGGHITKPCSSYTTATGYDYDMGSSQRNAVVAPFENLQSDIMRVRFNNMGYYYSNPEPVVVLQAAPYFKEAGRAGSTSYSITAAYSKGVTDSTNSSVSLGVTESFSVGIFRQNFSATYTQAMSAGFGRTEKESFTTSFSASNKDTVVVETTPVTYYSYDVYNSDTGTWSLNDMAVNIAGQPLYTQITVDQYNDFADYYNNYIDTHKVEYEYAGEDKIVEVQKLNKIDKDKYYLGNEGNPSGYTQDWARLPEGKRVSRGTLALGYQGGSTTSNYGQETSESETNTKTTSIAHSLSVTLGGPISKLVGAWVGGSLSNSKGTTHSTVTTSGNGYSISGTVNNLNLDDLTMSGQFSEDSVKAYNFQWTFGKCTFDAHDNMPEGESAKIPVECYAVDKVTRGVQAPKLDTLTTVDDQTLRIGWTEPAIRAGETINGYNVYVGDIDGNYSRITETPLSADTTTYDYRPAGDSKQYSFIVTSVGRSDEKQTKDIESMPSNKKSTIFIPEKPEKEIITVGVKDKTLTYGDELKLSKDDLVFPEGTDKSKINMDRLGWVTTYKAGSSAGVYLLKAKGLSSDAYTISYEEGLIDVKEKKLTASDFAVSCEDKTYDGNDAAKLTASVKAASIVGSDDVCGVIGGTYDSATAGTDKTVSYEINGLSGRDAANYVLDGDMTGTCEADIDRMAVTFTFGSTTFVYDGQPHPLGMSASDANKGVFNDYTVEYKGEGYEQKSQAPSNVGTYTPVIKLNDKTNYVMTQSESEIPNIEIVKPSDRKFYIICDKSDPYVGDTSNMMAFYGGNSPTVKWSSDNKDIATVDENGVVTAKSSGSVKITATMDDANYEAEPVDFTLVVRKKPVNLSVSGRVLTYDGTVRHITLKSDDPNFDPKEDDNVKVTYVLKTDSSSTVAKNVGEYYVDYEIDDVKYCGSGSTTLLINKVNNVEIVADDASKKFGEGAPAYTVQGHLLGDDQELPEIYDRINSMFTMSSEGDVTSAVAGTYDIAIELADGHTLDEDPNYNFTIGETPGTLTVEPSEAALTIENVEDVVYTAEPAVLNADVLLGEMTLDESHYVLKYFSDETCADEVSAVEVGTYYVKAIGNSDSCKGESDPVAFSILKADPIVKTSGNLYYNGKNMTGKVQFLGMDGSVLSEVRAVKKNPGSYSASFEGNETYNAATGSWKIVIKPTKIKKLSKGKKSFKVKVVKLSKTYVTGYSVRYSLNKNMSKAKTKTISKKYNKVTMKVKKLKKKKTYYVQVRSYMKISGKNYYSSWSAVKKVKTK